MAYDPQAGLKAREAANYSGEEKGAYVLGYDAGYYKVGQSPADPVKLKYPNAYSAGFWDGQGEAEDDRQTVLFNPTNPRKRFVYFMAIVAAYLVALIVVGFVAFHLTHR